MASHAQKYSGDNSYRPRRRPANFFRNERVFPPHAPLTPSSSTTPSTSSSTASPTFSSNNSSRQSRLLTRIRELPLFVGRPSYPRQLIRGTRRLKQAKPWKCLECGLENEPTHHLLFDLPAFKCRQCDAEPPVVILYLSPFPFTCKFNTAQSKPPRHMRRTPGLTNWDWGFAIVACCRIICIMSCVHCCDNVLLCIYLSFLY